MNFNTRKTHLYLTLSAALCVGSTFSAHAASVNINNPGFESNWSGWNDTDPSAITSDERSGSKGAKITGSSGKFEQEVNVENNTNYTLSAYVKGSGKIGASVNGERYTRTGGGSSYEEVTVSFNSGSADTVTIFGNYDGGEGRFDDFTLVSEGTTDDNSGGSTGATASVPGTIQAEDYDNYSDTTSSNRGGQYRTDGVDIQTTSDSGGGYNVGWIAAGEWLEYDIDVNSTASYTLDARVASSKSTGSFIIQVDGSQVGDEINVGNTGGWQSWTTKSIDLGQLSVGTRTLRVFVTGKDFNLNWLDISETGGGNNNGGGGNTGGGNTDGNDCEASGRILYNGSCDEYSAVYEAEHGDIGEEDHLVSLSPIEMTFDALAAKHVTPNGNGWRHELKIKSSGGFRVGMTELYEEFKAKITARLDDGAKTIVAQHHADTTATITKLYIADLDEGGFANAPDGTSSDSVAMNGIFDVYIRLAKEDGSGETKHLLTTIRSGESFDFEEINDHGTVTIKINGQSLSPITVNDSSASYFKFGNYQQAQNPETGDKLESGDRDGDYDDFYAEYFNTSEITFTEMSYTRTVD